MPDPNEEIIKVLFDQDELTWQNIIYELVNSEDMNPWDIDVSLLAKRFLEIINELRKMDFRITGKLVLAAALLLKIKSNKLIEEGIATLDELIEGGEEPFDLLEELEEQPEEEKEEVPRLKPRTPQPRKVKVSVHDLVKALEKALEAEAKRMPELEQEEVKLPERFDIAKVIMEVYKKVEKHYSSSDEELTFSKLVPESASKQEKVYTFIPLLHLDHQGNIGLRQEESFGEIFIAFLKKLEE